MVDIVEPFVIVCDCGCPPFRFWFSFVCSGGSLTGSNRILYIFFSCTAISGEVVVYDKEQIRLKLNAQQKFHPRVSVVSIFSCELQSLQETIWISCPPGPMLPGIPSPLSARLQLMVRAKALVLQGCGFCFLS